MKVASKMWLDGNPSNQPSNTTRQNYNINNYNDLGSVCNEYSTRECSDYHGKEFLASLPVNDNKYVIFSLNNEIGLLEVEYNNTTITKFSYTKIIEDASLNFDRETNPVGDFYINDNKETIIVFGYNNGTKIVNLNKPVITDFDLINKANPIQGLASVVAGGSLETGGYIVIGRYIKEDQSRTNFFKVIDNPISVISNYKSGKLESKSINIGITNIDRSYKYLEIGVIHSKEQTLQAYITNRILIDFNTTAVVSISYLSDANPISLNEVIVDTANYKFINNLTVIKNHIYGWGIKEHSTTSLQKEVNKLSPKWYSRLVSNVDIEKNINRKTFQHGEVYFLTIRFNYTWGTSFWFPLIGREGTEEEKEIIGTINETPYRKYQVDDTCSYTEDYQGGKIGEFSFFENTNDTYKGDKDLPTGRVRMFKFPSINWLKENIYTSFNEYGSSVLDRLGIYIPNINLNNFKDLDGNTPYSYEIGYCKRDFSNSTVIGQSIIVQDVLRTTPIFDLETLSLGGNFRTASDIAENRSFRTFPVEILNNLVNLDTDYYREELKLNTDISWDIEEVTAGEDPYQFAFGISDFTKNTTVEEVSPEIKIPNASSLLLNNTIKDVSGINFRINNVYSETCYVIEATNTGLVNSTSPSIPLTKTKNRSNFVTGREITKLITLYSYKSNCYLDFKNYEIVAVPNSENLFLGGDCFINNTAVTLYGSFFYSTFVGEEAGNTDLNQGVLEGNVFVKVFKSVGVYDTTNYIDEDIKHYPNLNLKSYYKLKRRDLDPNLFNLSINKDYSLLNTFNKTAIYEQDKQTYKDSEYKIIRSKSAINDQFYNLREFERDSYYMVDRSKGKIVNIAGERDFIYIHTENELFKTVNSDRAALDNQSGLVYIQVGDIFEYPLYAIQHSKLGELGVEERSSCLQTEYGYLFLSLAKRKYFLLSDKIQILSDEGLINIFNEECSKYDRDKIFYEPSTGKRITSAYDYQHKRVYLKIDNFCAVYSFAAQGWSHFVKEENVPNFMFNGRVDLLAVKDNVLYLHNDKSIYNRWYRKTIESSISHVFVFNSEENHIYPLLGLKIRFNLWDKIRAWNSNQSTGYINLVQYDISKSIKENIYANIRKFKDFWYYSYLRDAVTRDKLVESFVVVEFTTTSTEKKEIIEINLDK